MDFICLLLILPLLFLPIVNSLEFSEKFIGSWKLDHDENIDAWLTVKGIDWFKRKIFNSLRPTKVFEKNSVENETFNVKMLTSLRNIEWKNVSLGKEFTGPRLDGLVKVLFEYDSVKDELIERHRMLSNIDAKPDFLKYYRVGDYLVMQLEYDGVVAVRLFKKSV